MPWSSLEIFWWSTKTQIQVAISLLRNSFFFFNSLAPGRSQCDFKNVIFNLALLIGTFKSSYDNVLRWMPQDLTDDKSALVQVMAWCRQATNHYLNQCWQWSPMPYGITRPQWVKCPICHCRDYRRLPNSKIMTLVNIGTQHLNVKWISHILRPVIQRFDVFFVGKLNDLFNKQLSCQWFKMPRHSRYVTAMIITLLQQSIAFND